MTAIRDLRVDVGTRGGLRRTWRLFWVWTAVWAVSVPAVVVVLAGGIPALPDGPHWTFAALSAPAAALAVGAWLLPWPLRGITFPVAAGVAAVVSLAVDVVAGVALVGGTGWGAVAAAWAVFEWPALLGIGWLVAVRVPPGRAAVLTAVVGVAVVALPVRLGQTRADLPTVAALAGVAGCALAVLLVVAFRGRVRTADRSEDVDARLHDRHRERTADLHHQVGDGVAAVLLEARIARLETADPAALAVLDRIEAAGTRALAASADVGRVLHDDGAPTRAGGLADLPAVVDGFTASGRVPAVLEIARGVPRTLPSDVDVVLHRVVVEALANVRRHAGLAAGVRVQLAPIEGGIGLWVTDTGGPGPWVPDGPGTGGTGLSGLQDRLVAVGGQLAAGRHGDGWRVTAALPVAGSSG